MKTIKQKIILDASGSMDWQQNTVISGFKEQIQTMKQEEIDLGVKYLVTVVIFNFKVWTLVEDCPLEDVPLLTTETYNPKGGTALLDAIGSTIDTAEPGETDVNITIYTDGAENSSRNFTADQIKTLIEIRTKENKWGFTYFGANVDAFSVAQSYGISNSVSYTDANLEGAMKAASLTRSCYTMNAVSGAYNVNNLTASVNTADLVK